MGRRLEECPHCQMKPLPCPFCGSPAVSTGDNMVECTSWECGASVDWGHWTGESPDGVPAVHFVIEHWNKRATDQS